MRKLCIAITLFMASATGYCQQYVTEGFLRGRIVCKNPPAYPDLGRSRLQAPVVLSVDIDKEGKLKALKVLSGHALLNDSAIRFLRGCTFDPLMDGESPKEMSGVITIWYDLAENQPVYGIDLPVIKVLGKDAFEIEGNMLNRDRLVMWLESKQIRKNRPVLHLSVKEDAPVDVLKLLRKSGAGNIFIHYE
jgi:TonB family protein